MKMPDHLRRSAPKLESHQLAKWAARLKKRIASTILGLQSVPRGYLEEERCQFKKMNLEQCELWKKHLEADRGTQVTGRPRRKSNRRTGCTLSIDLAGPFRYQGRDPHHKNYKYLFEIIEKELEIPEQGLGKPDLLEHGSEPPGGMAGEQKDPEGEVEPAGDFPDFDELFAVEEGDHQAKESEEIEPMDDRANGWSCTQTS